MWKLLWEVLDWVGRAQTIWGLVSAVLLGVAGGVGAVMSDFAPFDVFMAIIVCAGVGAAVYIAATVYFDRAAQKPLTGGAQSAPEAEISLADAARLAYESADHKERRKLAAIGSGPKIEEYIKNVLLACAGVTNATILARRGEGFPLEPVATAELDGLWPTKNGGLCKTADVSRQPIYYDARISRDDVRKF